MRHQFIRWQVLSWGIALIMIALVFPLKGLWGLTTILEMVVGSFLIGYSVYGMK